MADTTPTDPAAPTPSPTTPTAPRGRQRSILPLLTTVVTLAAIIGGFIALGHFLKWHLTAPWKVLLICMGVGAVGALANALNESSVILPQRVHFRLPVRPDASQPAKLVETSVLQLGFLGNTMLGAFVAGTIVLYEGILKDVDFLNPAATGSIKLLGLNLATSGLMGWIGPKIITDRLDKLNWQQAGRVAASRKPSEATTTAMAAPTGFLALRALSGNSTTNGNPTEADF